MAEQGLLNALIKDDYTEFPFVFNGNLAAQVQDRSFWDAHRPSLRLIHFTWKKPFEYRRDAEANLVGCDDADCHTCLPTLKEWWKMHDEMMMRNA